MMKPRPETQNAGDTRDDRDGALPILEAGAYCQVPETMKQARRRLVKLGYSFWDAGFVVITERAICRIPLRGPETPAPFGGA